MIQTYDAHTCRQKTLCIKFLNGKILRNDYKYDTQKQFIIIIVIVSGLEELLHRK